MYALSIIAQLREDKLKGQGRYEDEEAEAARLSVCPRSSSKRPPRLEAVSRERNIEMKLIPKCNGRMWVDEQQPVR